MHYIGEFMPSKSEMEQAVRLTRVRDAAPAMLAALKALDAFWTESHPVGPDGDRDVFGGIGRLSDETVAIWRQIRSAIALAEGATS